MAVVAIIAKEGGGVWKAQWGAPPRLQYARAEGETERNLLVLNVRLVLHVAAAAAAAAAVVYGMVLRHAGGHFIVARYATCCPFLARGLCCSSLLPAWFCLRLAPRKLSCPPPAAFALIDVCWECSV